MRSLLSAEGILLDDISVDDDENRSIDDSLFRIHLQQQYSATRQLEEFMTSAGNSKNGTPNFETEKYLRALKVKTIAIFTVYPFLI